ncbi:hypothetical protein EAH77_04520 [Ewingella americana]|uniref:Uncharacterized protein n=1 Tax=Ewingella americana TaxID=41202 RepID=A0A502GQB3_9GAMM|nr:hypothetical protein EAH77_04520 [Ewingella americana]
MLSYRTGGPRELPPRNVKRFLRGAARSSYHQTKEEALRAFVYRKIFQLEKFSLPKKRAACVWEACEMSVLSPMGITARWQSRQKMSHP